MCISTFNFDKGAFWSGVAVAGTGPWRFVPLCSVWEQWKQTWSAAPSVTFLHRRFGNWSLCRAIHLQGVFLAREVGRVEWPFLSVAGQQAVAGRLVSLGGV